MPAILSNREPASGTNARGKTPLSLVGQSLTSLALFAALAVCGCGPSTTTEPAMTDEPSTAGTSQTVETETPVATLSAAEMQTVTLFVSEMGERLNLF